MSVFISYRRSDSAAWAGRIYDQLSKEFENLRLFIDVANIVPGDAFAQLINETIAQCEVMLVIIGPQWLEVSSSDGKRRLDDPDDFVRMEIEAALKHAILIIPVLVDGATLSKESNLPLSILALQRRSAAKVTHEHFAATMRPIVDRIAIALPPRIKSNPFASLWLASGAFLNIAGLAHVAGDAIRWVNFFQNIWAVYRLVVRDPLVTLVLLVWPSWWFPFPKILVDWFIVWSGIWIAINIYHYQFSGKLKLLTIFSETRQRVSDNVFFLTNLNWMIVELYALVRATIALLYQYLTLPLKYFHYAVINKSPLGQSYASARRRSALIEADIRTINLYVRGYKRDSLELLKSVDVNAADYGKDDIAYAQGLRRTLIAELRSLDSKIEQHYLFLSARRVMVYYFAILAIFGCFLFLNYTILTIGWAT